MVLFICGLCLGVFLGNVLTRWAYLPEIHDALRQGDEDRALNERLRAAGIKPATRSLDRPREVAKLRPGWLVRLMDWFWK